MIDRQDHNSPNGYGMLPKKKGPARWFAEQGPNTGFSDCPTKSSQHLAIMVRCVKPAVGSENPSYKSLGIVTHRTSGPDGDPLGLKVKGLALMPVVAALKRGRADG